MASDIGTFVQGGAGLRRWNQKVTSLHGRSVQYTASQLSTRRSTHAVAAREGRAGDRTRLAGVVEGRLGNGAPASAVLRRRRVATVAAGQKEHVEVLPWTDEEVGVVVVDHGSRAAASNHMLHEFVGLFKAHSGRRCVEAAHMELAEPSIGQAIDRCAKAGCKVVVVAPLFLFRGRHVQNDIPALVAEAASQHSGIRCLIAPPLGVDTLLAELVERRVNDRLAEAELVDPRLHAPASSQGLSL